MGVIIKNYAAGGIGMNDCQPGSVLGVGGTLGLIIGNGNLNNQITNIKIIRRADQEDGHWEMFLTGDDVPCVKLDLMMHGYRILYGAGLPGAHVVGTYAEVDDIAVVASLADIVQCVVNVAVARGDWTGTMQYNCQDFVVAFLQELHVQRVYDDRVARKGLKYELKRYVQKTRPPTSWMDQQRIQDLYGG